MEIGEAPGLAETLPHFSLHPHQSALAAVQALLRLGRAVARPAAADALYISAYPPPQESTPQIGAAGEVREAAYGCARYRCTQVRVASEAHDAYAESESLAASQAMGLRLSAALEDNRVANDAMAAGVASYVLALALLEGRADEATVPLRPDLEVWDVVTLEGEAGATPPGGSARVITGLVEEASPARRRYVTKLGLGSAPGDYSSRCLMRA